MNLLVALTTFVVIFPAELPDKTFVATLVLSTRYRPLPVWVGVSAAFAVQSLVAVTAGGLIALLPRRPVLLVTALLFAVGAFVLIRGAGDAAAEGAEEEAELEGRITAPATGWRAALASFGVLFAAEWGDFSQLLTAGLVVRYDDPVAVFVGSWLALITVAALAVLLGRALLRWVSVSLVRRVAGSLFAVLAVITAAEALGIL